MNPILLTDSYKASHWKQYPPNTTKIYSYLESRGGMFDHTIFFGLQHILKEYLVGVRVTKEDVEEAKTFFNAHFGSDIFNYSGWMKLVEKHGGKFPIKIKAVPEGSRIPVSNVLMTVENTDPEFFWLTNYLETILMQVWYPITIATLSNEIRRVILSYLEKTGSSELIDFKLHDFGFRGVSSVESAGIGGAAHLINFMGTDTLPGILTLMKSYHAGVCGHSIPAAEHSTITSWGQENEAKAYENMLTQFSEGLVAVVSDSFSIYNACKDIWGDQLKEQVLNRKGTLVIRPDSGDPATVVCSVLQILGNQFGYTVNSKGYKVLPPNVRVIQGDGIDYESIQHILESMEILRWSTDNVALGMGGALLQKLNRDTQKMAFKCSMIEKNEREFDVYKDPITDHGKRSKRGRLALVDCETVPGPADNDMLRTVFENGELLIDDTLSQIRERVNG